MRTRMAAGEDSACALHAITEYDILWVANVVIKFGTRKAPQGASLGGFSILHAIQQRAPQPISLRRSTHVLSFSSISFLKRRDSMPSAKRGGAVRQLRSLHRGLDAGFPPREDGRQGLPRPKAHGCACHRKARSQPTLQHERAARASHSRRPSPHRLECADAVRERARARVPVQSPRAPSAQAPCAPSPTHAAAAENGNDALPNAPAQCADAPAPDDPYRPPRKGAWHRPPHRHIRAAPPRSPNPQANPNASFLLPPISSKHLFVKSV